MTLKIQMYGVRKIKINVGLQMLTNVLSTQIWLFVHITSAPGSLGSYKYEICWRTKILGANLAKQDIGINPHAMCDEELCFNHPIV